ncbi:aerolysin family beta-barrel pore-forming toxin [Clostridium tarantellae]|uniref:Aerolysin family beta-barrel pore-forming toxin n=1 Tax=Clostridium tarantellae TaxID=39493 RepID=A0A6I1MNF5_9CLOT|nr:aerolysin family beta-barrel pore-forming toxin [Clostridium tarantellae]
MNKSYIVLRGSDYVDVEEIKNFIILNSAFQKIWFNFANALGFQKTKGDTGKFIGENIKVFRDGDNYVLIGASSRPKNLNT